MLLFHSILQGFHPGIKIVQLEVKLVIRWKFSKIVVPADIVEVMSEENRVFRMAPYKTSGSLGLENKVLSLIHLYYSSHLKYTPTSRYSAR